MTFPSALIASSPFDAMSQDYTPQQQRRKRSYRMTTFLVASTAVALTVPTCAFQNAAPSNRQPQRYSTRPSRLSVVTDPKEVMSMELPGSDDEIEIQTLENLYVLEMLGSDGLMGELVEGTPSKTSQHVRTEKATTKPTTQTVNSEEALTGKPDRIQFRGLSTTPKRKGSQLNRSLPKLSASAQLHPSRSSTMPGFLGDVRSDREKAYNDGIKLVEQRSGKKFVETEAGRKKRHKQSGEYMYKQSASVPESLVQFANEIHEVDRITPTEEISLGELTQEAIRIQKVYDSLVTRLDRDPTDEEWCAASGKINMEALSQAIEDGLEAKNKLVTSNLRMVQGVVNVYIRNGLRGQYNAGDLMQEGIMALIRAAEKFDPTRGFRFSTYAMYWIRSAIKRNQILQSRVMNVPQRVYDNHKKMIRIQNQLRGDLGRQPTKEELSKAAGMTEREINRCMDAMAQREYSLDQQVANPLKPSFSANDGKTMYELVDSKFDDEDYNKQNHAFMREDLLKVLRTNLTEEEVKLLLLRYGLNDSLADNGGKAGPLTIAEVSQAVGLKPDKVRRIINRSLKQMKNVIGSEWLEYERELR